jgi:hypothetical protein
VKGASRGPSSGGRPSRLFGPEPFLLFAVIGVFFPWVTSGSVSSSGLQVGDGLPVLALSAGAFLLSRGRVRWAWIPAGLGAVVVIRDIQRVLGLDGVSVGVGLWMAGFGLIAATGLLLARELARARAARRS